MLKQRRAQGGGKKKVRERPSKNIVKGGGARKRCTRTHNRDKVTIWQRNNKKGKEGIYSKAQTRDCLRCCWCGGFFCVVDAHSERESAAAHQKEGEKRRTQSGVHYGLLKPYTTSARTLTPQGTRSSFVSHVAERERESRVAVASGTERRQEKKLCSFLELVLYPVFLITILQSAVERAGWCVQHS